MTGHRVTLSRFLPRAIRNSSAVGLAAVLLTGPLLTGCGSGGWFGDADKPPLEGTRISILRMENRATPDPALAGTAVAVPPPARNAMWPQAGGYPDHAMGHLALSSTPVEVWRSGIGDGSGGRLRLLSRPVVADGRVYTLDASSQASAYDEAAGRRIWQTDLVPGETRGSSFGGGVAFADGVLYAATGYAEVIAINPGDGTIIWRKHISGPARGAPTVAKGRVIAQTLDNQTIALSTKDGETLWSHTGILETAGLLGSVSAAADGSTVIAPYSSGELVALRIENGRPAWQDNLTAIRRYGALSGLADIRGMPVIDRGLVLAVSHSGRTVAIDERTGARVWDQELGGVDTPWVAGDYIFVLTNESELVALTRQNGRIRWVASLLRYEDAKDKSTAVVWSGPVLAGDRLWLTASTGELVGVSPANGEIVNRLKLSDRTYLPPVVANGSLYVLTDAGTLAAFR
ncbi:MAG: PQQ-binding-like beta-propeller repeat protein [Rhodospirillaceae bacterium]